MRQAFIEALDIGVNILVRERLLRHPMTLQQSIGLKAVETESLAETLMSEDASPKLVDGECLANRCGQIRVLGTEPLLDVRGQVDVNADIHGLFLLVPGLHVRHTLYRGLPAGVPWLEGYCKTVHDES
jgi:hypothetical protein